MSQQGIRTLIFVIAAAVLAGGAYWAYPRPEEFRISEAVKKPLFPEFTDPQDAARIIITKVDEELGQLVEFDLVKDTDRGIWVIPSRENYPADAEGKSRDATTALIDLIPTDFVSEETRDQATYGLLKPSQEVEAAQTGIGLLVRIENDKGKALAELIIGKRGRAENEENGGGKSLYFVRRPDQNAIYVAEIDPSVFPTEFKSWIKEDLLQLDAFDISRVEIDDYNVPFEVINAQGGVRIRADVENLKRRMKAIVDWNDTEGKWSLQKLLTYQGTRPVETSLGELEELNTEKLNDLKFTLDSLKIVNVRRKPEGLGADLKAGRDFLNKRESLISLQRMGFYPWPVGDQLELFAENGELIVATKDGVEYLLRFGQTDRSDIDSEELNRYLMVTVRIDESQFTEVPPEVRRELDSKTSSERVGPLAPPSEAEEEKENKQEGEPQPPAPLVQDEPPVKKASENPLRPKKKLEDEAKKKAATTSRVSKDDSKKEGSAEQKKGDTESKKNGDSGEKAARKDSKDKKESSPAGDAKSGDTTLDENDKKSGDEGEQDPAAKEAQRKLDELKDKYRKARAKVDELNFRFGDWYYVISEKDFRKIHLTRRDLIRETSQAKEKGFDIDAFRSLQEEGLKVSPSGGASSGLPSFPGSGN